VSRRCLLTSTDIRGRKAPFVIFQGRGDERPARPRPRFRAGRNALGRSCPSCLSWLDQSRDSLTARLMLAAQRRTIIAARSDLASSDTFGGQVKALALLGVGAVVAAVLGGSVREASAATTSTVFSTAGCQAQIKCSDGSASKGTSLSGVNVAEGATSPARSRPPADSLRPVNDTRGGGGTTSA
jgi:hypothetical protein